MILAKFVRLVQRGEAKSAVLPVKIPRAGDEGTAWTWFD